MNTKLLTITITFSKELTSKELHLRHILSNTIEDRNIGDVIDEGSGVNFIDMCIRTEENDEIKAQIISMLESLGLLFQTSLIWEVLNED